MERGKLKNFKKRFTSLMMCATVLATSIQLPAAVNAAEDSVTELPEGLTPEKAFALKDGNFQCGDTYWTQFVMLPEWEWDYTTSASFVPEADGMLVDIQDVGADGKNAGLWTIALQQEAFLYEGLEYTISFDLTSSIPRGFSYVMESNSENAVVFGTEKWGEITEEQVGTPQHFSYTLPAPTEDFDGKFHLRLGAPDKGISLDPHTVKVSNVRVEVEGAREKWVLVDDYNFMNTDAYTLEQGSADGYYVDLGANGSITYSDLNVVAGETYELTFIARTDNAAEFTASVGSEVLVEHEKLEHFTNVYSYTYTYNATETKTVDLKIAASGNGSVLIDNIGLWNKEARKALGLGEAKTELEADGAVLTATEDSYPAGTDVEIAVEVDDFAAWSAEAQVFVDAKPVDADLYTFEEGKLTVKAAAFTDMGKFAVSVAAPGYARSTASVKIVKANGNILENGDFEDNFTKWTPFFNERYSGSASITSDYMVEVKMAFFLNWWDENGNDNGPVSWSTLLEHDAVPVKAKTNYKVSFWASSTVERPIMLEIGDSQFFFVLTPELTEYSAVYEHDWGNDREVDWKFHLGPITSQTAPNNNTGMEIATTDGHTMYFADITMIDEATAADYVPAPSIIGIDNDAVYTAPVAAKVGYRKDYVITLTKDGKAISYTAGDMILENGDYVITVADKADASIKTEKSFTIAKNIDYTKEYFAIRGKATEKVIEVIGIREGGSVVQSTFAGRASQLFTLETIRQGYFVIRALSSGKVIQVVGASAENGAKLEQAEYTGENHQLWRIVEVPQGFVKLENKASGKVIDVSGAAKTENLQLQQYDNAGSTDEGQANNDGQRFDLIQITDVAQYMETFVSPAQTEAEWKENAFITPLADKLNPAGPIAVEWYAAPGSVKSYDIYFDGKLCKTVDATDAETLKSEDMSIYTTEVAAHTMKIVANYASGKTLETKEINFFVTKKGVGWATLHRTGDMNLSWYYHWSLDPALGTDKDLTFVPMIWGNYGDEWLADPANKKWGTVLSFNEPDWSDQSNVPVTIASAKAWVDRYNAAHGTNNEPPKSVEESWQPFMDSGLRVGSPATALAPPYCNGTIQMNEVDGPDNWWFDFQDLMDANADKGWDYDFVAIHSYNDSCDAKGFLRMVDETYELTGKPIWITEFGVAEWGQGKWASTAQTRQQVKEFIIEVCNGLEERDFVERYAWFPFDPNDAYGGASGIFNYATGELNELGQTYAMLGLPEGYEGVNYDVDLVIPEKPVTSVTINADTKSVKFGETLQLSATVAPSNATDKTVTWKSEDETIATVDENGLVTAIKTGTVTITAKAGEKTAEVKITVVDDPVPVTGVTINKSKTTLYVGESATLATTIAPADATTKTLTYSSSDPTIATVDAAGKVTALKTGNVVITAKAYNGNFDTISFTITTKPATTVNTTVKVTAPSTTILIGQTVNAAATVTPAGTAVTWKSSNEAAATVSQTGAIKGVAAGRTTITATAGGSTASIEIYVNKPTVKWNVSYKTCPLQLKKSTKALKAIGLQPGDKIVSYKSSKKKIATVSKTGKIKAKKVGTTTITVTTLYGATAKIKIKVQKKPVKVTAITVNAKKLTLKKGKTSQLVVTKKYITSLHKITYTSKNKKVATVSKKGLIKAKKKGKTTITIKCQNKTKKVKVTVK